MNCSNTFICASDLMHIPLFYEFCQNAPMQQIFYNIRCLGQYIRRRPTFPGSRPPSIISTMELNFRVRDGNGWNLHVIVTGFISPCTFKTEQYHTSTIIFSLLTNRMFPYFLRLSARSISIGQLNVSLHVYLRPINHIVYVGPYQIDILSRGGLHA